MPGFGAAPSLPPGVEPTAANLAAALHEELAEPGSSGPTSPATASAAGWRWKWAASAAASVTASPPPGSGAGRSAPPRARPHLGAAPAARSSPLALRIPQLRERALATFAAHPERIPADAGRELVLGWIDAEGYDGANRAMREHVFDPAGYPEDVPVTIAWGERDQLVGPPRPERRPAGARFLVLPGVGHTPTWDDPELVAQTLLEGSAAPAEVSGPSRVSEQRSDRATRRSA